MKSRRVNTVKEVEVKSERLPVSNLSPQDRLKVLANIIVERILEDQANGINRLSRVGG